MSFSILRETVSPWENGPVIFGPIAAQSKLQTKLNSKKQVKSFYKCEKYARKIDYWKIFFSLYAKFLFSSKRN